LSMRKIGKIAELAKPRRGKRAARKTRRTFATDGSGRWRSTRRDGTPPNKQYTQFFLPRQDRFVEIFYFT
jgi:hypothetical protein